MFKNYPILSLLSTKKHTPRYVFENVSKLSSLQSAKRIDCRTLDSGKVAFPIAKMLAYLFETNRVTSNQQATFLFANPFSWSTSAAPEELWLGGATTGPYQGRGIENVRSLLEGNGTVLMPPWNISRSGAIPWKMRTHCNHYEVIRSEYLIATR